MIPFFYPLVAGIRAIKSHELFRERRNEAEIILVATHARLWSLTLQRKCFIQRCWDKLAWLGSFFVRVCTLPRTKRPISFCPCFLKLEVENTSLPVLVPSSERQSCPSVAAIPSLPLAKREKDANNECATSSPGTCSPEKDTLVSPSIASKEASLAK